MRLSPPTRRRLRLLRPRAVRGEVERVGRKLVRRARRVEERVVTLEPEGTSRGRVLFSYILDPFCLPPGREVSHDHTHDWESLEMARAFVERGYTVDAIHWTNLSFEPQHEYAVFVDPRLNMERLAPRLGAGCVKILHAETGHWTFHNEAQRRRLAGLAARRGLVLPPYKLIEENRAAEHADALTILGNEFTAGTYAFAGKPMVRVPISSPYLYPFPEGKDFEACRRRFLWFGSGGLVHKGLDLVLEAFAGLPGHHLTVCGPIARERDFELAFWRELYETPNIDTVGWVDVAGPAFRALAASTLGLVYPSCSEGGGGSAINCMHAGLVPVLSYEASVDVAPEYGRILEESSVAGVRRAVKELSARPAGELEAMARASWRHAREHHTREGFAAGYRRALDRILEPGSDPDLAPGLGRREDRVGAEVAGR